jgi:CubicO group peptidase (beta-lactamase class C family)
MDIKEPNMQRVAPESQGFSAERLGRIRTVMGRYVDQGMLPGIATLIARRGEIVHLDTIGWADIEARRPLAEDTIYRIYSMSKPVTIVAALLLWEEGRFLLDDEVGRYIPELGGMQVLRGVGQGGLMLTPPRRPLTIRHLMTHTAGMTYGSFEPDSPGERLYGQAALMRPDRTLAEMIDVLKGLPLLFDPGERWLYSIAIDVVGRLVEVVSGQTLDTFMRERIFAPLGMTDTGFCTPEGASGRLATLYTLGEGGALTAMAAPCGRDHTRLDPLCAGGAGLVSSITDYARFAAMLANGGELDGVRLLAPRTVALMGSNHLPPAVGAYGDPPHAGHGFGLGVRVLRDPAAAGQLDAPGSFGWSGLASTEYWADPASEMVGVIMMQFIAPPLFPGYPTHAQFRNLAYQALVG